MSKVYKTGNISTNTEQQQQEKQQQLNNSLDHDYYVARGQKGDIQVLSNSSIQYPNVQTFTIL